MSDKFEFPKQNSQELPESDLPPLEDLAVGPPPRTPVPSAMAEATPLPPPSADSSTKSHIVSFSIWPPTERTRNTVRERLIETLSTPSILSKRYGTIPREESIDAAKKIEEDAFEAAGKSGSAEDNGIEILQVYSKEISKRMLETVKARSAESGMTFKADEDDAGSTAPPQSRWPVLPLASIPPAFSSHSYPQ